MPKPMISLCMIVKNEEECLPRALGGWFELADELIVVDTGSSDRTQEIATQAGARLLHYEWRYPGNKGEARNLGIEAAQGDWIVVLDADEIILDRAGLRRFVMAAGPQITGVNVLFENYHEGQLTLRWYQPRVFRRGLYTYRHREHELPFWRGDGRGEEPQVDFVFEHRAPSGRDPAKMQPMIDRLLADVEDLPSDPTPAYFLHRQYLLAGDFAKSIEAGRRYLAICGPFDPCECYGNMATCYQQLGDTQEAIRWLHKAAAEQAHRKIWWVRLAELHMTQGRWQLALAHLRLASELWPTFEWAWEPNTYGAGIAGLIEKCQAALAASYHNH